MAGADKITGSTKFAQGPPTPKGRDTRRRLLEAAASLFAERGYAHVRVSDITEAAGLSPGAFYRYFVDRRELTIELLRGLTSHAFDFVRVPWDDEQPVRSVRASTQRYFEFYEQHRALFGVLVELSQTDAEVAGIWAQSRERFYGRIAKSLARGIDQGAVRADIDAPVAAELLGSMSEFYAFQRFLLGGDALRAVPIESVAETLATIWTSGVLQGVHAKK